MDNTIPASYIRTVVSTAERRSEDATKKTVSTLERETTEEYAIAMLNRLANLKPDDFRTGKSMSSTNFIVRGSMGKNGYSDNVILNRGYSLPDAKVTSISVTRGLGDTIVPELVGGKTRSINSKWMIHNSDGLSNSLRQAFSEAVKNLKSIIKF